MVSTVHNQPQVRLFINDVPAACSGNCSFQWDESVTPSVTEVSPSTGSLGTSVDISGLGFSAVMAENTVTIGGVPCIVTASSIANITCSCGNGPLGSYPVVVTVEGSGTASGQGVFSYTADITSISPTSGSLGGKHYN